MAGRFNINIAANYIGFAYATAVSLLFMPPLHAQLGAESFGLIGIYVLLMNVMSVLDLGLVSTVSRECAIQRDHPANLRHVIRFAEKLMLGVALVAALVLAVGSDALVSRWMQVTEENLGAAVVSFHLIAAAVLSRWLGGLYRGVLNGFERQFATSGINILATTLRFPVSYGLLVLSSGSAVFYFQLQLGVALLELATLYLMSYRIVQRSVPGSQEDLPQERLGAVMRFSGAVAVLMLLTTTFTQLDKVVLSSTLSLREFGDFSLVASLVAGIAAIGGPVATALLPRLSSLQAARREDEVFAVYMKSLRLLLVLVLPAGLLIVFFSWHVLFSWTGNARISDQLAKTLAYYTLGNCFWVLAALPGYLKYARGDLRFLVVYNLVFLLAYAPLLVYGAAKQGAEGAGAVWLTVNAAMLVAAHTLIHQEFFDGAKRRAILFEFLSSVAIATGLFSLVTVVLTWPESRLGQIAQIACTGFMVITVLYGYLYGRLRRLPL